MKFETPLFNQRGNAKAIKTEGALANAIHAIDPYLEWVFTEDSGNFQDVSGNGRHTEFTTGFTHDNWTSPDNRTRATAGANASTRWVPTEALSSHTLIMAFGGITTDGSQYHDLFMLGDNADHRIALVQWSTAWGGHWHIAFGRSGSSGGHKGFTVDGGPANPQGNHVHAITFESDGGTSVTPRWWINGVEKTLTQRYGPNGAWRNNYTPDRIVPFGNYYDLLGGCGPIGYYNKVVTDPQISDVFAAATADNWY